VELSFKTGEIILVYGEMDEDGFYMGELDGVRGLVPSNFLAEAPDQYGNQMMPGGPNARGGLSQRGRGQGPGARGPPPPPRDMPSAAGQRGSLVKSKSFLYHFLMFKQNQQKKYFHIELFYFFFSLNELKRMENYQLKFSFIVFSFY